MHRRSPLNPIIKLCLHSRYQKHPPFGNLGDFWWIWRWWTVILITFYSEAVINYWERTKGKVRRNKQNFRYGVEYKLKQFSPSFIFVNKQTSSTAASRYLTVFLFLLVIHFFPFSHDFFLRYWVYFTLWKVGSFFEDFL